MINLKKIIQNSISEARKGNFYDIDNNRDSKTSQILSKEESLSKVYSWTREQDNLLIYLVSIIGCKWKFISKYFSNKTLRQIYNRYIQINPNVLKGHFTKEEDNQIIELVQIFGFRWSKIASIIKHRSPKQIRSRYILRLKKQNE